MESIRYLALGDSYTIGTGLEDEAQNFPSLLAARLRDETGIDVALTNLGVNGYTTTDLIREELPVARSARPELVSILIGANDVVQGSDEPTYRARLTQIYEAVKQLGVPGPRVLAISIPDFSALPGAAPFGTPSELRARIDAFNAVAQYEAASRPFRYVDITSISREASTGDDWMAADGLHPGPAQHRAIADHLWEVVAPTWRMVVFNRFSPLAKRVLDLAFAEVEAVRSQYTGSEHILIGLLKVDGGDARKVLDELRVTYRRVRKLLVAVLGRSQKTATAPATPILTTKTTQLLSAATHEATKAGADTVATEHLLIALIESDGIAAHVLADQGVTVTRMRGTMDRLEANPEGMSHQRQGAWSRLTARLLRKL
ncbi:MAG: GDSL-type esterase/lipase family protein [Candidatus Dormibacteraeota bacterium]|nr:GDSL-type esterase/lipase family protein [Candidatus Dormibacteraeota bacterium]